MEAVIVILSICCFLFIALFIWSSNSNRALAKELEAIKSLSQDGFIERGKFSELGLMSAGIAHEISNPLSVILGRLQLLQRIYRDPLKQKEVALGLNQIQSASQRIEKTIKGIRSYIYRNDDVVEDQIALSDIIDDVLVFCGERLKNHGIEFRTIGTEAIFLRGHKGQFEQALLNLINNSFDAVDKLEEKWIEIVVVEEGDVVDIYFKDSGHGIAPDVRQKMMEPFYSSKPQKGSGLGLPLVKSIAERHSGSLTYIDKSENTTFLLELPKAVA